MHHNMSSQIACSVVNLFIHQYGFCKWLTACVVEHTSVSKVLNCSLQVGCQQFKGLICGQIVYSANRQCGYWVHDGLSCFISCDP